MEDLGFPQMLSLRIRNLRNLRRLDLDLQSGSRRILVTGGNGAGKTTVLEAVYLLARGRSFRGRKAGVLTSDGEGRVSVEGRLRESGRPDPSVLVFEGSVGGTQRRFNGTPIGSLPPRDSPLRVKLVGENPQSLLEGEPRLRRALLDWNLFHVEHQLGQLRSDLRRILAQRNAALRRGGRDAWLWDPQFVEISNQITIKRIAFLDSWRAVFRSLSRDFRFLEGCQLHFERGWPKDLDLSDVLERGRTAEQMRCQTLSGPHRADFILMRDGMAPRLSRGQSKVAVCLLQLAAEGVHRAAGLGPVTWLLDDIDSEIDVETSARLRALFGDVGGQQFVTQVATGSAGHGLAIQETMFHVEHGVSRQPVRAGSSRP